jgi:hypothetical protein
MLSLLLRTANESGGEKEQKAFSEAGTFNVGRREVKRHALALHFPGHGSEPCPVHVATTRALLFLLPNGERDAVEGSEVSSGEHLMYPGAEGAQHYSQSRSIRE